MDSKDRKQIWKKIHRKREALGLYDSAPAVRNWWISFELCNQDYPEEVLQILESIEANSATLPELWLTYTFSMDQEVGAVLECLALKKRNLSEKRELAVADFLDSVGIPLILQ